MNNDQICNSKVEVPTGLNLNDKDYINSLLSIFNKWASNIFASSFEVFIPTLSNNFTELFNSSKIFIKNYFSIL